MSDGASVPSNFREMMSGIQRRIAVLERSLDKRARQSQVDMLDKYVDKLVAAGAPPTGSLTMWSAVSPPSGWLLANGQAVSRTTYADLFAIIGTTYGAGNGSTTFNLPNLKGRVPVGYDPSQTEFNTMGETGGAKTHAHTMGTHTHSIPAHSHGPGSFAATAMWTGSWLRYRHRNSAAWTPTGYFTNPVSGSSTATQNVGLEVVGTSGEWSGDTGATDPGDTAAGSSLAPYLTLNYIIKA